MRLGCDTLETVTIAVMRHGGRSCYGYSIQYLSALLVER